MYMPSRRRVSWSMSIRYMGIYKKIPYLIDEGIFYFMKNNTYILEQGQKLILLTYHNRRTPYYVEVQKLRLTSKSITELKAFLAVKPTLGQSITLHYHLIKDVSPKEFEEIKSFFGNEKLSQDGEGYRLKIRNLRLLYSDIVWNFFYDSAAVFMTDYEPTI